MLMPIDNLLANTTYRSIRQKAIEVIFDEERILTFGIIPDLDLTHKIRTVAEESLRKVPEQQPSRPRKRRIPWTPSEDARILEGRSAEIPEPFKLITRSLEDRTEEAVKIRWRRVLLKQHPELGRAWTPEEEAILLDGLKRGDSRERINLSLPNRTKRAVRSRVTRICQEYKVGDLKRKRTVSIKQAESDPLE